MDLIEKGAMGYIILQQIIEHVNPAASLPQMGVPSFAAVGDTDESLDGTEGFSSKVVAWQI